jgi:hypothetical protein
MLASNKEGWAMLMKDIGRLADAVRESLRHGVGMGNGTAQRGRRAQVLLMAEADGPGWTDAKIAEACGCRSKTVVNSRERFGSKAIHMALHGEPRPKPPPAMCLHPVQEAKLIATRLGSPPPGFANWTLRLPAEHVVAMECVESISHETVRRTLKKTV